MKPLKFLYDKAALSLEIQIISAIIFLFKSSLSEIDIWGFFSHKKTNYLNEGMEMIKLKCQSF